MAEDNPTTVFDTETLNNLGGRLLDHAEDMAADINFEPLTLDLRMAARACSKFSTLRFRVGEIAGMALIQDGAATRRDLLDALADARGAS
jgi:hypothetical protein